MAKPKYPQMPIDEALMLDDLRDDVIVINRSAAVQEGGRRFSFSSLSVVGNHDGIVGIGYGKAKEVPAAVEKSVKDAKKSLLRVVREGTTIPHMVEAVYCSSRVRLIPARPGTGIIAGKSVRKIVEFAGITDVLTKVYGSTNPLNVVKATMAALGQLQDRKMVESARGVQVG